MLTSDVSRNNYIFESNYGYGVRPVLPYSIKIEKRKIHGGEKSLTEAR
jgi:hypothetical protein